MPKSPSERGGPQVVSTCTALYVLFVFSGQELDDIHRYDLNKNQWTELKLTGTAPDPRSVVCLFTRITFVLGKANARSL